MPLCLKCNKRFPTKVFIEGKQRNLCNRKYCLHCSPFGQHNTSKLDRIKEPTRICLSCARPFDTKQGKEFCAVCRVTKARQNRKQQAIEYKGGCCEICGYDKCTRALEFHHLDPNEKDFGISNNSGLNRSWEKLRHELDKCILVCSNCHAEIHEGLVSL